MNGDLVYVPASRVTEKQWLKRGDVLIAASSGSLDVVGKAARIRRDEEVAFGAFCKVLRPTSEVDAGYFAHFFQTKPYRRHVMRVAAGSNINNLKGRDLDDIEILLPPMEDQRRVAAVLDAAEALRAKRRHALSKLEDLINAVFVEMFSKNASDVSWDETTLGEVADIVSGATPKTSVERYWDGEVRWVTPKDLSGLQGPYIDTTSRTLSADGLKSCSASLLPSGSVLLSSRAPIGYVAINKAPMATNQGFKSLVPDSSRVDPRFLWAWLRRHRPQLESLGSGATFKEISKRVVEGIDISLPPIRLQARFGDVLDAVETMRTKLCDMLVEIDALCASLQQRAFRGEL
ncbi:restriction endonuclease subunit S [Candidatus Poriferisodalis sp.]|uniref:restriction endonuclease subunit S n=1 Tax=Candidatus Poriferisodalis sp. TaxID=3101277 RepID=UPI003B028593